ncbi:unnamed protein product, partial [Adineta ricciae]
FGEHEFEKAIELLHNEIQLQKKTKKEAKENTKTNMAVNTVDEKTKDTEEELQSPHNEITEPLDTRNISNWTTADVRTFLMQIELSDVLPLFGAINGRELVELYAMCKLDSVSMYRSLKSELLRLHDKVLTIATYLHFIDRLRSICDNGLPLETFACDRKVAECLDDSD